MTRAVEEDLGTSYVVTGASGWLGAATLEVLEAKFGSEWQRRVVAFASQARRVQLRSGAVVTASPLADATGAVLPERFVLVHLAGLTRDRVGDLGATEFLAVGARLRDRALALASRPECAAVVVASSGAVYGAGRTLDPGPDVNPYGKLKLDDERAFGTACETRGIPLLVLRLFSVSGPYMTKPHLYALGDLATQVLTGNEVLVRSSRPVLRSYLDGRDVAAACLSAIDAGAVTRPTVIDGSGSEVVEVGELADRLRRVAGRPELPIRRPVVDGPEDRYLGDPAAFAALAEAAGVTLSPLDVQLEATLADLRARLSGAPPA